MSITQTADGWTFTRGRETFGPFESHEAAATTLYDLERGKAPAQQPGDLLLAVLDYVDQLEQDERAVTDWILRESAPVVVTGPDDDGELVATDSSRPIAVDRWEGSGSVWLNFRLGRAEV